MGERVSVVASLALPMALDKDLHTSVGRGRWRDWLWHRKNELRRLFGKPNTGRECCSAVDRDGHLVNLSQPFVFSPDGKVTYRRCKVCKARHFEAIAPKGHIGLKMQ
jgi:hypothetical protein